MSPQHTQTPFEVMDEGEHFELLADGRARTVGIIYSKEDAAFIVRACNSHEALVKANEAFLAAIGAAMNKDYAADGWLLDAVKQARAALALAKEG